MGITAKQKKLISISAGIGAFLVAALLIGFWADRLARDVVPARLPSLATVDFSLQSTRGGTISNKDLIGGPVAMFFGFTHCPEVCPATLFTLDGLIADLGRGGEAITVVFVTVDPDRDTAAGLADYLGAIDEDAIGLTGSPAAINAMLKGYGIYAERVDLDDGDYTMDHTATVFLYDSEGHLDGTIAWGEPPEYAIPKLQNLIKG
ncbi:MAG: SCO family protein [Candidatus Puniceispirillales bacterium]